MKRIRYDRRIPDELQGIHDWIAANNPAAARRVITEIFETIARLAEFSTGRNGRVSGTREQIVSNLPYVIVYAEERSEGGGEETINVITVRHTSRQPLA